MRNLILCRLFMFNYSPTQLFSLQLHLDILAGQVNFRLSANSQSKILFIPNDLLLTTKDMLFYKVSIRKSKIIFIGYTVNLNPTFFLIDH